MSDIPDSDFVRFVSFDWRIINGAPFPFDVFQIMYVVFMSENDIYQQ